MACLRYFALKDELGFPIPSTMRGYKKDPCKCELVELKMNPDVPAPTDKRRYHPGNLHYFYQIDSKTHCVRPNSLIMTHTRPKGPYKEFILFDVVTVYTAVRTEDFTRDNCPVDEESLVPVPFSKTYESTVSQADADAQAAADPTYAAEGQANANTLGVCTPV